MVLLVASLAGCAQPDPRTARDCPAVAAVPDAVNLIEFQGQGRDLTDVLYEVALDDLFHGCSFDDEEVETELLARFIATRGPADTKREAPFTYFVAIADERRNVLAREEFQLVVPFEGNRTKVAVTEEITPTIPLPEGASGNRYTIFVGLKLTEDQFQYNRRNQ